LKEEVVTRTVTFISVALAPVVSACGVSREQYVEKPNEELFATWTSKDMHPPTAVGFLGARVGELLQPGLAVAGIDPGNNTYNIYYRSGD
jgi:hypothetical protein